MDIEQFTERARGFLQAAGTIAIREYHQRITPEHLLKAMLDDAQGAAAGFVLMVINVLGPAGVAPFIYFQF